VKRREREPQVAPSKGHGFEVDSTLTDKPPQEGRQCLKEGAQATP